MSHKPISVLVAQFPVSLDIAANLDAILSIVDRAERDDLVVLPEGALSGYAEDPAFLGSVDTAQLDVCLHHVKDAAAWQGVHIVFGSCLRKGGAWTNAGVYYGPGGEEFVYEKINLATHERGHFAAGSSLPVVDLVVGGQPVRLGIQLCREIRFPEQWQHLARAGAEVFAYLTNAVGDETGAQAGVWRSHLVSRAAENQRFVLAANNAGRGQKCPSLIAAPDGRVVWEVTSAGTAMARREINLAEVSSWYLDQARLDVVGVFDASLAGE